MPLIYKNGIIRSTLICGAPLSGKTTVLKELCTGFAALGVRVAVIDERRELAECSCACMDVFSGYPRKTGIEQALRLFSPNLIIFDELGNESDAESLLSAANAGVAVITTAHAPSFAALKKRRFLASALESDIFELFAELDSGENVGRIVSVRNGKGEVLEGGGACDTHVLLSDSRKNKSIVV